MLLLLLLATIHTEPVLGPKNPVKAKKGWKSCLILEVCTSKIQTHDLIRSLS